MYFSHTTLLPLFVAALSGPAAAAPYPLNESAAPDSIPSLEAVTYSGTGCPSSAPGVERSGAAFADPHFRLKAFSADTGDVYSTSANCQVHLTASGRTPGWQVGLSAVDFTGHAKLDPGAKLDWFFTSFFSDDAADTVTVRGAVTNTGSTRLQKDIHEVATIPAADIVWSACGDVGLLNVNFRIALNADGAKYAYFGKDADTVVAEAWKYTWRRC
jgi:hypothetical protein